MEADVKRYLLFAGDIYYPAGGWDDFVASFDLPAEARTHAESLHPCQWWQIIDGHTGQEMKPVVIEGTTL
jgi:hypothetical protein